MLTPTRVPQSMPAAQHLVRRVESAPCMWANWSVEGYSSPAPSSRAGFPGSPLPEGALSPSPGDFRRTDSIMSMCSSQSGGLVGLHRVNSRISEMSICADDEDEFEEIGDGSTGCSSDIGPNLQWRIIWCFERVHKKEQEARKRALCQAANEAGAVVICLKKACKFGAWLGHRRRRPPFVLLTDWREAKPCEQALQERQEKANAFVILCEKAVHFDRASAWAHNMQAKGQEVHVLQDMGDARTFVTQLRGWIPRNDVPAPRPPLGPSVPWHCEQGYTMEATSLPEESGTSGAAAAAATSAAAGSSSVSGSRFQLRAGALESLSAGTPPPLRRSYASAPCMFGGHSYDAWGSPDMAALSPLCAGGAATHRPPARPPPLESLLQVCASHGSQLEQLLRESAPDHYED